MTMQYNFLKPFYLNNRFISHRLKTASSVRGGREAFPGPRRRNCFLQVCERSGMSTLDGDGQPNLRGFARQGRQPNAITLDRSTSAMYKKNIAIIDAPTVIAMHNVPLPPAAPHCTALSTLTQIRLPCVFVFDS